MRFLNGKKVLVTGGAGFLGANLIRILLSHGAHVHALVHPRTDLWRLDAVKPRIQCYQADLIDYNAVRRVVTVVEPAYICHLARHGPDQTRSRATLDTNITATLNLLEATGSLEYSGFLYTGSSLEYGHKNHPIRETDLPAPNTFYGATKAAGTLLCQQFAREMAKPIVVIRIFSIYGFWESGKRLIPTAINTVLRSGTLNLTSAGYRRDLIFAEDVVEVCLRALDQPEAAGQIINAGTGQQWTNEEVVEMIQTIIGKRVEIHSDTYPARASDTSYWVADISKARTLLDWTPRHDLRTGLEKTIAWFHRHQHIY